MARKGLSYDIILSEAVELIKETGFNDLSLHKLAERLGVKTSSLYKHISGKNDLIGGINRLALERLDSALKAAVEGKERGEALLALSLAYREYASENPELYNAIIHMPVWEDESLKRHGMTVIGAFRQVLEQYGLSEEEIYHYSRCFRSCMHGFISLQNSGFFTKGPSPDESYEHMIKKLISLVEAER